GIFSLLLGALAFTLAPRLLDLGGRRLAVIALCALVAVVVLNVLEIPVASDLAKVVLALSAAPVLLLPIDRPWWLLPLAILLPAADVWSVYSSRGVTHAIVSRAAHDKSYIDWPTIATPIAGFDYPDFGRSGIVDVLFLTLFICAAVRWKLGARRLVFVLPLSVVATMVLAYETSLRAVPLLPMLCLGFLICTLPALWRDFRAELSSRER
ncbi:MAG: hypothetical protein JWN41_1316, partial [Thermoleophilia bacterium]|nr:hypothetical protein [Thermoleophilia bacterium]